MTRIAAFFLTLCFIHQVVGQSPEKRITFDPPVKQKIILSGSFAEIRGTHFHTGLDIKPSSNDAVDSVFSCADGYLSRIRADRSGYGRSLYIDHPSGYTTVYAHLKTFSPRLLKYFSNIQYAQKSYELDTYPEPGDLMIEKGEFIGILGNSGNSYGPHLHFEIRKTESEIPQNPILFGIKPTDAKPPTIGSVSVFGLDENMDKVWRQSLKTIRQGNDYMPLEQLVPASKIGVSIHCFDQMDGASNQNGIYKLKMFVDDQLYFQAHFDEISFDEYGAINTYIDYELREDTKRSEVLCFVLPSNHLSVIETAVNKGVFALDKERIVRFEVSDFEGNTSTQELKLKRYEEDYIPPSKKYQRIIPQGASTEFFQDGIKFNFSKKSLVRNTYFNMEVIEQKEGYPIYRLGNYKDPLLENIPVEIELPSLERAVDTSKLVFVSISSKGMLTSYGSRLISGKMHSYLGEFGDYSFVIDEEAPQIIPNKFSAEANTSTIFEFSLLENIRSSGGEHDFMYDVFIDGNWEPCEYKELTKILYIPLDKLKDSKHTLTIKTEDTRGNKAVWEKTFVLK